MTEKSNTKLDPNGTYLPWGFPDEMSLCEAAREGNLKQMSKQIGSAVNVNFVDGFGRTALHYVCERGNYEAVKLLVGNKATVNVWDANCVTPLHLAAKGDHARIVKFLLMSHADLNIECLSGCKAIDLAPFDSESWHVLHNAAQGNFPTIEHLTQTRTVPLIPQFAIQREIDKQAKLADKKKGGKKSGKKGGKKSGRRSGKKSAKKKK